MIPHKPDNKDTTKGVVTRITRVDNKDSTKRGITKTSLSAKRSNNKNFTQGLITRTPPTQGVIIRTL